MNFSNAFIVDQVLSMSQKECHDDVTIVCANGILQFNSFVLAAKCFQCSEDFSWFIHLIWFSYILFYPTVATTKDAGQLVN